MESSSAGEKKDVKLSDKFTDALECQSELGEANQFIDSCENVHTNKFDEKHMPKENVGGVQLNCRTNQIIERKYYNLGRSILTNLDFDKELECPVCLIIPRSSPIFQCRLGHSICSECHPRLPRPYRSRRCPVCQAKYCNPPARNFLAEKLLNCVQRTCRFDFHGCDFVISDSEALIAHETACQFRPKGFKVPKKVEAAPDRHFEVFLIDLLQNLVQLTIGLLVVLVVIFFLVSLVSVLLGSTFSFVRTVNSCQMSSKCKLNAPNLLELWNDDLKYKVSHLSSFFEKIQTILNSPKNVFNYLVLSMKYLYKMLPQPRKYSDVQPMSCVPKSQVTLYYEWPDTFLPASQDDLVWTPSQPSVLSGEFTVIWNVDSDLYIHEEDTRYSFTSGITEEARRTFYKFMRWKLDMKLMPLHCQIIGVEMRHGDTPLRYWDNPLLYAAREIVIQATITGWQKNPIVCKDQKFENVTWTVHFNAEACRMDGNSMERTN
eukprot:GFUD01000371.1.p1 GENE.GFUD01000371.1~~GFUD01000371.1.p1  ORF type:complete len:535 (+),score=51.63 GFUD01000371.1:140-1606(+)